MHKARVFLYACAGVFLLALSYHLGAGTAGAQAPSNPVVAAEPGIVYTTNGDAYARGNTFEWRRVGNVFSGAPTPALHESWGQLKARYR